MAGCVEGVVDGRVGCEKPLGRGLGLESLLLALPFPDGKVRVFGPVVLALFAIMMDMGKTGLEPMLSCRIFSRSVTMAVGSHRTGFATGALGALSAASVSLCRCITRSSTSPSSSTARQRYIRLPSHIANHLIQMPARGREQAAAVRRARANWGPSLIVQQRMVS